MKCFKLAAFMIISAGFILSGCGIKEPTANRNENIKQTKEEKAADQRLAVQLAKDYVVKTYGEITENQHFDAKREKDGTYTVHVYRDLGDHHEGIAWLNVNTKTKKIVDGVH